MWFSGKLWKYRSQSILRFRYHEMVRLKALDLYFSKIKKFYIFPQFPLIYVTVEDTSKSLKIAILSFTQKYPSSMLAETKGDWGRIINFSKVWIKTFQTHYLSCILGTWLLRYLHLKFCALFLFFHKKPPARK